MRAVPGGPARRHPARRDLTLGTFASQQILRTREPISRLRGQLHQLGGAVVVPTFHPAFLLRNPGPAYRRQAYDDLKLIRREYDRVRGRAPAGA